MRVDQLVAETEQTAGGILDFPERRQGPVIGGPVHNLLEEVGRGGKVIVISRIDPVENLSFLVGGQCGPLDVDPIIHFFPFLQEAVAIGFVAEDVVTQQHVVEFLDVGAKLIGRLEALDLHLGQLAAQLVELPPARVRRPADHQSNNHDGQRKAGQARLEGTGHSIGKQFITSERQITIPAPLRSSSTPGTRWFLTRHRIQLCWHNTSLCPFARTLPEYAPDAHVIRQRSRRSGTVARVRIVIRRAGAENNNVTE